MYVSDSKIISVQLALLASHQNIGIFNFMVTWSSHLPTEEEYLVIVSPPPPHGPDGIITASSGLISLENNTQYNITISLSACPENFNRTIVFGKI